MRAEPQRKILVFFVCFVVLFHVLLCIMKLCSEISDHCTSFLENVL
jgi:hypothetical protein